MPHVQFFHMFRGVKTIPKKGGIYHIKPHEGLTPQSKQPMEMIVMIPRVRQLLVFHPI